MNVNVVVVVVVLVVVTVAVVVRVPWIVLVSETVIGVVMWYCACGCSWWYKR